ncbi:MAG: 3-hydroxyacyl-CoA dehydrogenase family protein [Thermoleophilia bacterium]
MNAAPITAVVVGTGAMAPEIAAACAAAGMPVTIAGRSAGRAAEARARAAALGAAGVGSAAIEPGAFAGAGLVIETVVEDPAVKRELLARLEPWCADDAVIATNTSSLRIEDLAGALARPGRFGGLHFLKPAHLTAVVEVVPGPRTDAATTDALRAVAAAMGKEPLVVRRDAPGFIWNRIQFAVLRECLHMLEAGVADARDIDAAVSDGLAPRWMAAGPLATADLGGLPTFSLIAAQLFPHLASGAAAPAALTGRAAAGEAFAPWTAEAGAAVADLRAEALARGRAIAARRRELGA